jgi:hypothetical protein
MHKEKGRMKGSKYAGYKGMPKFENPLHEVREAAKRIRKKKIVKAFDW